MAKKLTDKVYWVGKTDWDIKKFHGNEYSINKGTSYNSYLIKDKKTALIDTVWQPFAKEYFKNLSAAVDIKSIDYIIANHAETDHSGSLPYIMEIIPDAPIYCTANAVKSLKGHYHKDWNFNVVKTGDTLDLGGSKLIFIEAPMLHWPDSMFCYLTGENILFPNDAFGQHYASESLFNDKANQNELFNEAIKYYANILTPFSPLVTKKINEVLSFNLPVNMICPSHGIIWRDNPAQIVEAYLKWANAYSENQISIIYDTMWNSTLRMAEAMADGIKSVDDKVTVKLFNAAKEDKNDVLTEIFRSRTVLFGSPTINNGFTHAIAGILEMAKGLKFKGKRAAAFGSYGWSGEAVKQLTEHLKGCGFEVVNDGIRLMWVPDGDALKQCFEFGKSLI